MMKTMKTLSTLELSITTGGTRPFDGGGPGGGGLGPLFTFRPRVTPQIHGLAVKLKPEATLPTDQPYTTHGQGHSSGRD